MLTTRLWMGSVLIALVVCMLVLDQQVQVFPYPYQLAFQCLCAVAACFELTKLLGTNRGLIAPLLFVGVVALTLNNWIVSGAGLNAELTQVPTELAIWRFWATVVVWIMVLHFAIFLWEMAAYRQAGRSFERMARTWWGISYLGLMPTFFAQIRWLYFYGAPIGTAALAMAIFVPKGCDIGAYTVGRLLGRTRMTPLLSPKKTWEGAAGGIVFAVLVAIGLDRLGPAPLRENLWAEIGFGVSVGIAGMLGDLAESLIKRDCEQKDASQVVVGYGGVLDVVDAVIFAAPVAYVWFFWLRPV